MQESLSSLVGDDEVFLVDWSDCLGSSVEEEPLVGLEWHVILDSQSILMSSNMLSVEECSSSFHSRSELELDSVVEWLSWPGLVLLIDPPGLAETVVAVVVDDVSVVGVGITLDLEALLSVVLDVSSRG